MCQKTSLNSNTNFLWTILRRPFDYSKTAAIWNLPNGYLEYSLRPPRHYALVTTALVFINTEMEDEDVVKKIAAFVSNKYDAL